MPVYTSTGIGQLEIPLNGPAFIRMTGTAAFSTANTVLQPALDAFIHKINFRFPSGTAWPLSFYITRSTDTANERQLLLYTTEATTLQYIERVPLSADEAFYCDCTSTQSKVMEIHLGRWVNS